MSKQYDETFSTFNFNFDNCQMCEPNFLSEWSSKNLWAWLNVNWRE